MHRVLLTGSRGFTGIHLRSELENADYEVIGSIIDSSPSINEVSLDITSIENCRQIARSVRPDFVVHLAGISFIQHPDPLTFYLTNVIGTLNLLQALVDENIKPQKILIPSSANVYGDIGSEQIKEEQRPAPISHYATSKMAMEFMVHTWFDKLPIVITRPFNYTGIGQPAHFLIPKIVSHFAQKKPVIELGNIYVERDFSDVRMVAAIYRKLLESNCGSQVMNICTGRSISLHQVITLMEKIAGYKIQIKINPGFIRPSEIQRLAGSTTRLEKAIGPLNSPDFEETLLWMYKEASAI